MSNLKMPSIVITFESKAASFIARSQKGTVLLILRDDDLGGETYNLTNVTQIPTDMDQENADAIIRCFMGYVNPPSRVLVACIDDSTNTLANALAWAATQHFDYLCGPLDVTSAECLTIATWIASERTNNHAIYKAVLPNYTGNSEAIVNFTGAGIQTADHGADDPFTSAEYCSRIAGILAGTPMRISSTYATLPEVLDVTRLTPAEQDTAVGAGKYILWYDGTQVRVGRAVNSLTTTTDTKGDAFKKCKIVEILDMIQQDIRLAIVSDYIGKYANSYDNKLLLITAIRGYMQSLELSALVQPGWEVDIDVDEQEAYLQGIGTDTAEMTERQIREADTGSWVFLRMNCKPLDAIEDVKLTVRI